MHPAFRKGGVAVITGAAVGIGYAIAARLLKENMKLVLFDRDEVALAQSAQRLESENQDATITLDALLDLLRRGSAVRDRGLVGLHLVHIVQAQARKLRARRGVFLQLGFQRGNWLIRSTGATSWPRLPFQSRKVPSRSWPAACHCARVMLL